MKKRFLSLILLVVISCQKDDEVFQITDVNLSKVFFLKNNNPSLNSDLQLSYDGESTFQGYAELGTNLNELIATYEFVGVSIRVEDVEQQNSTTKNDFSKELIVTVYGNENIEKDYSIRLSYYTGLPIVYIDTFGAEIVSRENYISANFSMMGGLNYDDLENTEIQIRGRGNSTWDGDTSKKPYQIKFTEKTEVLSMPDDRRWVLLSEAFDRSMIRNKLTYEMGDMCNFDFSPQGRYVEVFINDEPRGTYVIAQKIEESKNRVKLGDDGYLIEIDQRNRVDEDDVYFEPYLFRQRMEKFSWTDTVFNIKEPDLQLGSNAQVLIENHINTFETVLYGNNFKDPNTGYRSYIDVDSFVDWYVINEIGKSVDAYGYSSVFFTYTPGEKIKMGPLWDFDLSYGNADYNPSSFYTPGNWISEHPWFEQLLQDEYFLKMVQDRFNFFYQKRVELIDIIDGFATQIDRSQELNYILHQSLGEPMWNNEAAVFYTYGEEVEYLKSWLSERLDWMAGNLN